jgi:predicted lipase
LLTDYQISLICATLYDDSAPSGFWSNIWATDGAYAALTHSNGYDVVVWRGSVTKLDFLEDFASEVPIWDKELGHCAYGFHQGMRQSQPAIDAVIGQNPIIVTGHSLGAAHAALYAAHLIAIGKPLVALTNFGEPRPGFERIRDLLKNTQVHSYRNNSDPVTEVPTIGIGNADLYVHSNKLIPLSVSPPANDPWGPLQDHHIDLYIQGVINL